MIHSGLPFFNPLLGVGGVAFPWALPTQTSPPSSPPPSPGTGAKVSSFTIDAILGRRRDAEGPLVARRRDERLVRAAPYTASGPPSAPREGPAGPKAKAKRVRTIFTAEQLERLEAEFARQQYMVGPERLYLAAALQLTEAQVKVWFQNRRIKWRKAFMEQQHARLSHSPGEEGGSDGLSLPPSPLRSAEDTSSAEDGHRGDEEHLPDTDASSRASTTTAGNVSPTATRLEPLAQHQQQQTQSFPSHFLSNDLHHTRHLSEVVTDLTCKQ